MSFVGILLQGLSVRLMEKMCIYGHTRNLTSVTMASTLLMSTLQVSPKSNYSQTLSSSSLMRYLRS